jgi:hypothetical protein
MAEKKPGAELEPRFSSDSATPTPWAEAREANTARAHGSPPLAPPFGVASPAWDKPDGGRIGERLTPDAPGPGRA